MLGEPRYESFAMVIDVEKCRRNMTLAERERVQAVKA